MCQMDYICSLMRCEFGTDSSHVRDFGTNHSHLRAFRTRLSQMCMSNSFTGVK